MNFKYEINIVRLPNTKPVSGVVNVYASDTQMKLR